MDTIVERGCGLDIAEETVVACLMVGPAGRKVHKEVRTYLTFTAELEKLRDWLLSEGCTHVAMESTGPYWVPVYAVLEQAGRLSLWSVTRRTSGTCLAGRRM